MDILFYYFTSIFNKALVCKLKKYFEQLDTFIGKQNPNNNQISQKSLYPTK